MVLSIAMLDSFSRSSRIETEKVEGLDLGFMDKWRGVKQVLTHNSVIRLFTVALLRHSLLWNRLISRNISPRNAGRIHLYARESATISGTPVDRAHGRDQ